MDVFHAELAQNPLLTRQDAVKALLDFCRPLLPFYSAEKSTLHVGSTGAHYGEKSARMEGWARVLWGLGPLFGGDNSALPADMQAEIEVFAEVYRTGLIHGTDPANPGYWGDLYDYDQKMVETAALDVALALAPNVLWDPLTAAQKQQVFAWLNQINQYAIHPNNWRFFRILTNMVFGLLGLPVNEERLQDDFAVVEHCYHGKGWYFDGNDGQLDYYIPFAMHFYSLIWAALTPDNGADAQGYKALLKSRSAEFTGDFIQWFSDDGAELPFGRSLTYRFAHSAFFSALSLAGAKPDAMPWGAVRHTVLQNLRHWLQYPITDAAGVLSIGYAYPNLTMSEKYNAPGSPYWAFKAFLFLALPQDHPFWQQEETTVSHPAQMLQEKPRMIVCHDLCQGTDHLTAYPVGQHCMNHGNCAAKYEKFVYSNRFGFSVSRGEALDDGAFDNVLAASFAGADCYRMRYGVEDYSLTEDYTYTAYRLLPGVQAKTWVVPCADGWHVRIHEIVNEAAIDIADGGFALPVEEDFVSQPGAADGKQIPGQEQRTEHGISAVLPWGAAGIYSLDPCDARMIRAFPNTNLFSNLTAIPTLQRRLEPGRHLLIHCVFGDVSPESTARLQCAPVVANQDGCITVTSGTRHVVIRRGQTND